jgi:peroxiredoxin
MKFLIALLALFSFSAFALTTGEPAPDFTLKGLNPKLEDISLDDFKGKIVVLEWLNNGCPFVKKHYESGNMQSLQRKYTEQNVIWLSIVSSAPGKQGHVDKEGAIKEKTNHKSSATDVVLDPDGKVGKLYGAKTTPHMFIIDKNGNLVYQGAIDDKADTDKNSILSAKNYVAAALDEVIGGKKVTAHTTKSYGCAVKY